MAPRLLLAVLLACTAAARAESFSFVALGDTTYAIPADDPLYAELIDAINAARPAFSIHVGDTKGFGDCGPAFQQSQRAFFGRYDAPVFYTPGNNEWADCWKENRGAADPTAILALMRKVFWSRPESLGRSPVPLVREADELAQFAEFAEGVARPNVTRLQVYGWPDMKAVRVSVDTSKPWVFAFEPLYSAGRSVSPNRDRD